MRAACGTAYPLAFQGRGAEPYEKGKKAVPFLVKHVIVQAKDDDAARGVHDAKNIMDPSGTNAQRKSTIRLDQTAATPRGETGESPPRQKVRADIHKTSFLMFTFMNALNQCGAGAVPLHRSMTAHDCARLSWCAQRASVVAPTPGTPPPPADEDV